MNIRVAARSEYSCIRPLWEKLNKIHEAESPYHPDYFATLDFETRMKRLDAYDENDVLLQVVENDGELAGYLLSTCRDGRGFIESLYLEPQCRGLRLGEALMQKALDWMNRHGARSYGVNVAWGHESVFGFYEKFGFYPIRTELERRLDAQKS